MPALPSNLPLLQSSLENVMKNPILHGIYRCVLWFPPLMIVIFFLYGFISYNFIYCYFILYLNEYYLISFFYFVIFNTFFFLAVISFIKAIYTDGGTIPPHFSYNHTSSSDEVAINILPSSSDENFSTNRKEKSIQSLNNNQLFSNNATPMINANNLYIDDQINDSSSINHPNSINSSRRKEIIICKRCDLERPVRAHHCGTCGVCRLKMDHHCPVLNNCVGFYNYKYFVLLLTHSSLMCLWIFISVLSKLLFMPFVGIDNIIDIQFLCGLGVSFGLTLVLIPFAVTHYYLVLKNTTTLEYSLRGYFNNPKNNLSNSSSNSREFERIENIYDIGMKNNFIQVFGNRWEYWLLPVFTSIGDGCYYPTIDHQRNQKVNIDSADIFI